MHSTLKYLEVFQGFADLSTDFREVLRCPETDDLPEEWISKPDLDYSQWELLSRAAVGNRLQPDQGSQTSRKSSSSEIKQFDLTSILFPPLIDQQECCSSFLQVHELKNDSLENGSGF